MSKSFVYHDRVNCSNLCTEKSCVCCCHPKLTPPAAEPKIMSISGVAELVDEISKLRTALTEAKEALEQIIEWRDEEIASMCLEDAVEKVRAALAKIREVMP